MVAQTEQENTSPRFMLALVMGTMMNPLNSTMLATALFALCNSFKISIGQGAILITALYVTSTIAQPLMGRLADIFSAKKINLLGFVLVFIAAGIGIIAPNFSWLIISRIILGLGTSAAYPSAMALINRKYAEMNQEVPGDVLGIIAISGQVSMILGPVLGGFLTQWLGWRGIFYINIPWVLIAVYLSLIIPDYPSVNNKQGISFFKRLDVPGILIFSAFLLSLLFVLTNDTFSWLLFLASVILLVLLVFWERSQEAPFIDVRLLQTEPALLLVYFRTLATNYVLYQMLYGLPQWLEGVKNISPAQTGLLMVPDSVVAIVVGLLISKSKNLFGQNFIGVLLMFASAAGWLMLNIDSAIFFIVMVCVVIGLAEGVNLIANQALLNREAPLAQKGVSFGLFRTFGYIGAIISSSQLKIHFHGGITDPSFHQLALNMLYPCAALAILLIPLWLRLKRNKNQFAG